MDDFHETLDTRFAERITTFCISLREKIFIRFLSFQKTNNKVNANHKKMMFLLS